MNASRLLLAFALFMLGASSLSTSASACGGPQCICSDMTAFDRLPGDPAGFSRLDFGYALHELDIGMQNFLTELQRWAGADRTNVAATGREFWTEVKSLRDCFCGRASYAFLTRSMRGFPDYYDDFEHAYSVDMLINQNDSVNIRMRRIRNGYVDLNSALPQ